MKKTMGLLSVIILIICSFTFLKSYSDIIQMLEHIADEMRMMAVINHIVAFLLLLAGIIVAKYRTILLSLFLLYLSLTAFLTSVIYLVPPNMLIFGTFFTLTLRALIKKELSFSFNIKSLNGVIGVLSLINAFYYLHWVDSPMLINAIIYSPLGLLNCPTMLAFCGLICFLKKPSSLYLEFFVGSITLYYGFLGMLCLGAHIDIFLIIAGMFLLVRLSSRLKPFIFYNS